MNNNRKLPPSPSSSACRKPLFDITNIRSTELVRGGQSHINRPQSTKNIKSRISQDEQTKPKMKQIHNRRKSMNSLQENREKNDQKYCRQHKNRVAMYQVQLNRAQYFCLECSFLYAKQGYKLKHVCWILQDNDKSKRIKQTKQYLQKCRVLEGEIINWKKDQNSAIKQIYERFANMLTVEKQKMEADIQNVKNIYENCVKYIQQTREEQVRCLRQKGLQIEKISICIDNTKNDIQLNYDDCIDSFDLNEFRVIMDEYWKQTKKAQQFFNKNSVDKLINRADIDMKLTVRTMGRSNNEMNEFTFSKQKKFQTPPFSKEIHGIKLAQSHPDSNHYNSSLKESIVDSKIIFNEFNI